MSEAISLLDRLRNGLIRTTRQSMEMICLKASLTARTIELSSASDDPKKFNEADHIDRELMSHLIHRKTINWCDKTCRLVPLKNDQTSGSGLMRAVASSLWGLQDEAIDSFLRRLLHVALTSARQQSTFKERWQLEKEKGNLNSDTPYHNKASWEDVCSTFHGNEFQTAEDDFHLDPIHVFSLSNILRRPVLVLGDFSSPSTPPTSTTDLTGIYLPLLSSAESCVPHPLLLVRHDGLFRALVVHRVPLEWWQVQSFRSVPLVRVDQEPFHVRCLLTSESRCVRQLLPSYLKIAEISQAMSSGTHQVLTCRLSTGRLEFLERPERENVFGNGAPFRVKPFSESSLATYEGPSDEDEGFLPTAGATSKLEGSGCVRNCIACQTIRRAEQKQKLVNQGRPQSESDALSVRRSYSTLCENVRCKKEGSQKYGGRCYACYVVKDPWFGEEHLGDFMGMRRNEDLGCPEKELTVADSTKNSRKSNGATGQKNKVAETEFKDKERSPKLKDKRGHEFEHVKDQSAKFKDVPESLDVCDRDESDALPLSTADMDVHGSAKANDLSRISRHRKSEKANRDPVKANDRNESTLVVKTQETINSSISPQKVVNKSCRAGKTDPISTPSAINNQPTTDEQPGQSSSGGYEERRSDTTSKCIVDFCDNAADDTYRGLCRSCYLTLALHRAPRDQEEKITRPIIPPSTVVDRRCLIDGCRGSVTNQQLGLCLPCLRMQIFAARDLERMKEKRRSSVKHSGNSSRTSKVDSSTVVLPDERSSRSSKQRTPKSPNDVHAAYYVPSSPKLNYSPPRPRAKCCLAFDCDRYGDPSFDGYCSRCYERVSPELLVPRS